MNQNNYEKKPNEDNIIRPPQYTHIPKIRNDIIDELISGSKVNLINEGKLEGAINIAIILLILTVYQTFIRSIQENGLPHEIIYNSLYCIKEDVLYVVTTNITMGLLTLFDYFIIKLLISNKKSIRSLRVYHYIYISLFIFAPLYFIFKCSPLVKMIGYTYHLTFALKMQSYFSTNILLYLKKYKLLDKMIEKYDQKLLKLHKKTNPSDSIHAQEKLMSFIDPSKVFPNNVNLRNFFYFMILAPTLVYEIQYPRTNKIRWLYILKQLTQLIVITIIVLWLISSYIAPTFKITSEERSISFILKTAFYNIMPNFTIWLLSFYGFFHCYLNIVCELTFFGDRVFYLDWWNSTSITEFWRKWNIPVHEWALRHLYIDSIFVFNVSEGRASVIVFLFSAFLHEAIASYGFSQIKLYFFFGMMAQIPALILEKTLLKKINKRIGNIIMWLNLILGQPLIVALYMNEWAQFYYKDPCSVWCQKLPLR